MNSSSCNKELFVGFDEDEIMYLKTIGVEEPIKFSLWPVNTYYSKFIYAINRFLRDIKHQNFMRPTEKKVRLLGKLGNPNRYEQFSDSLLINLDNIIFVTPETLDEIYYRNKPKEQENSFLPMGIYVYGEVDLKNTSSTCVDYGYTVPVDEGNRTLKCKLLKDEWIKRKPILTKTVFLSLERIDAIAKKDLFNCNELRYMVLSHEIGHAAFQNVNLVNKTYQSTDFKDKAMHETQANFFSSFSANGRLDVEIRRKIAMQSSIYQYPVLLDEYKVDKPNQYKNYFRKVDKLFQ